MKRELNVNYVFLKNTNLIFTKALLNIYERNKEYIDKRFLELKNKEKIKNL